MNLETFFDKFELFADAPDAVAKLREFVLALAVKGRLVPQDPNDEPAEEQLARLAVFESERRPAGRTRTPSRAKTDIGSRHPMLPSGWSKATLSNLLAVWNGRAYAKDELLAEGTPVLRVGNLFTNNHWYYSNLELEPEKYCTQGDLIYAWSASFGPFIWNGPKTIFHYHIWKLVPHSEADIEKRFLYWLLQERTQEIKKAGHGVSMTHMTKEKMEKLPVALPPLAEQKRIVAKVDELMALCDRLEAQQQERETRHAALVRASLARFAEASTPANLEFLFHDAYAIPPADLRKSILTLAVQGRLGEHLVEGASEYSEPLSRVAARTNGHNGNRVGIDAQDLPRGWKLEAFGDVAAISGGVTLGRKLGARKTIELPYLRVANVKRGELDLSHVKTISIATDEVERYSLQAGDLLMTEGGDWDKVGRAAIWSGEIDSCLHQNHIFRARLRSTDQSPRWFQLYFNSPDGQRYFAAAAKQTTNLASINMRQVRGCPVPVPPPNEQRRIVAKVDELMALVDKLEAELASVRTTASNLLAAAIAELTQGKPSYAAIQH